MPDINPWAGISNLGALDQKLYQSTKTDTTPPSPLGEKQEVAPTEKKDITHKIEATQAVTEQEIRMTLPLPESSVAFLELIERTIFMKRDIKHRSKQRITKNNVARSWIGILKEVEIDWANIKDDNDLTDRLRKALKTKV
jgi:hypothetical protein